jgi:hypothetical protein
LGLVVMVAPSGSAAALVSVDRGTPATVDG